MYSNPVYGGDSVVYVSKMAVPGKSKGKAKGKAKGKGTGKGKGNAYSL